VIFGENFTLHFSGISKINRRFFEDFFFGYLKNKLQGIVDKKYRSHIQLTNLAHFGISLISN